MPGRAHHAWIIRPLRYGRMPGRAGLGIEWRFVGLRADATYPIEKALLGRSLAAADKIDIDDLGQQTLELTWPYPYRDEQVVVARRILGEARRPFRGSETRGEVVGREDGDGAARLPVRFSISRPKLPWKSQSWKTDNLPLQARPTQVAQARSAWLKLTKKSRLPPAGSLMVLADQTWLFVGGGN